MSLIQLLQKSAWCFPTKLPHRKKTKAAPYSKLTGTWTIFTGLGGKPFDAEEPLVEDVPPPPPPPLALQGFMQQPQQQQQPQPCPVTAGFPCSSSMASQSAPVQTFMSAAPQNAAPAGVPFSLGLPTGVAGPDPSLHQFGYQPGAPQQQPPAISNAGSPGSYTRPQTKSKFSKKSFRKKFKRH